MIIEGDATALPLPDSSVHAIVCDPPYELGFMGRSWDRSGVAFRPQTWAEALRVAIPGAHLLAFGGTRTFHRLAVAIEDAGWEIRDSIGLLGWCYGQGFPKSLDIGKAIDKAAGAERQVIGRRTDGRYGYGFSDAAKRTMGGLVHEYSKGFVGDPAEVTAPATADAERWQGWGTALKPAWEPIIVARKPFAGTVAGNVLANGVGGINVDGCRIGATVETWPTSRAYRAGVFYLGAELNDGLNTIAAGDSPPGRWPTNLLLTHHPDCADECQPECHVRTMDERSGTARSSGLYTKGVNGRCATSDPDWSVNYTYPSEGSAQYNDSGTASRFFPVFRYNAKASTAERPRLSTPDGKPIMHPTVKPVALLRWLVKLVTPPGGTVLDQFAGTGSTLAAAEAEGFASIGVELDHDYCRLAQQRLATPPTVDRPKRKRVTKPAPAAKPVTVWTVDEARAMRTAGYSVEHITRVTGHTLTPVVPST